MFKSISNILKNYTKKIIFGGFAMLLILFIAKQSFAQNFISTTEAIDKIEQVLSVPKGSVILERKSKINIDKVTKSEEEGEEEASRTEGRGSNEEGGLSIEVIEKRDSKANRLKEKLAYNAAISGQYEVSLELYKQILKTEKNNNYAKFGLATSYHKLKQYKQAKSIYYDLLSADIDNKNEIIGNFLEILVEESPKDAKYVLARLSAQSPNTDYILARSALTYNKLNNKDEATLLLKRAIAINPKNIEYQYNLAIILDNNNEKQGALKYYRQALRHYIQSGSTNQQVDLGAIRKRINFIQNNS